MSDYLWDKTGEADPDTKRLEELLGEFRHRPRALELPTEVSAHASLAPRLFRGGPRLSRPAWVAFAAALLLVFVAVAFVALRSGGKDKQVVSHETQTQPSKDAPQRSQTPKVAGPPSENIAPHESLPSEREEQVAIQGSLRKRERRVGGGRESTEARGKSVVLTATQGQKEHEGIAVGEPQGQRREGARASLESQRLKAKEQLVYALRLTSSKLKEVQRRTQGIVDSKSSLDGATHQVTEQP